MTGKDLALSLFQKALSGTKAVVHSRSTNVYGVLDNDDFFQYLGGMTLAIKTLDGTEPDVIVSNLTDPSAMRQESLDKFIGREMNTRYLNPTWITNMLDEGYAGARMVGQITDNMWGWQATTDQAIRTEDWQEWHDVYVADKYGLDIKQRFADADNVYAYQNMLGRMLEVARKDYWKPDEKTLDELTTAYLETMEATGLSCSDLVCGNDKLLSYVEQRVVGMDNREALERLYEQLGRIHAVGAKPTVPTQRIETPAPAHADRENAAGKTPDVPKGQLEKATQNVENQLLKGYKMEEETLFQSAENHPVKEDLDWNIILILLTVFGLGFLWRWGRG